MALACVVAVAAAGYFAGHAGGADLQKAGLDGARMGKARGAKAGSRIGYSEGFGQGQNAAYRTAYKRAYQAAYDRTLKAGGQ
jgi:hypothetical protein